MEEKPNYYAVIPAEVRYDNTLKPNEKLLYGEITALAQKTGECWASNKYFSELYGVKPNAIATWIRDLKNKNYIILDYEKKGKEIKKRIIKIGGIQKDNTSYQKRYKGGIQKGEENNTSINNTSIKEIYKEKSTHTPTLEEIKDYCLNVRHNKVDYKKFYDYFTEGNWIDSKGNKVKNWKQKVITWEKNTTDKKEFEYEQL